MAPVMPSKGVHAVCPIGPAHYPDPFWDVLREGFDPPLYADVDGNPMTFRQWCWAMNDDSYKRVGETVCEDGWRVSTVWIGVPFLRLYETMLFAPGGESIGCWGAADRTEADMMHEVIVALAQDATRRQVFLNELHQEEGMF